MGKIVYHGSFSEEPPHMYGETFHTGTLQAAHDRLDEAQEWGGLASIYKYRISDSAPTSRATWADPLHDYADGPTVVPEYNQKRIYPYKNAVEDKGSTSYVVPSNFVGNHVQYLGVQFQEARGEGGEVITRALRTMLGAKR